MSEKFDFEKLGSAVKKTLWTTLKVWGTGALIKELDRNFKGDEDAQKRVKIKNRIFFFLGVFLVSTRLFSEEVNDNYKSQLKIDKNLESLGYVYYDSEDYNSHILGFDFQNEIYSVDFKDNETNGNLDVFGVLKYALSKKNLTIGAWSSPSGHGRYVFVFTMKDSEPKLVGVITSEEEDFIEVGSLSDKMNSQIEIFDYDGDGKEEILLSFLNSGYIFVEIGTDKISIDYDKKNYQAIDDRIKSKSKKEFNKEFLSGTINKKNLSQKLKIYDVKEYVLKKVGGNNES